MDFLVTIRIALRALGKNKMRAGLTVLGVVIGIAAVTTMVSVGQSASGLVRGQFENFGTNMIVVIPSSSRRGGVRQGRQATLTWEDAESIVDRCRSVVAATPVVGASAQIIYRNANWFPQQMQGVNADVLTVRNWQLAEGGLFTDRDIASAAKVCVLGRTVVERLFQTSDPIGETVRIRNIPFRVVGVLEAKGATAFGEDQDNVVFMPYTTVRKRLQGSPFRNVDFIMVSVRSVEQMTDAQFEVTQLLMERHRLSPGESPDFEVINTTAIADALNVVTGTLTLMLAAIAGISLLVGGVGIMNIMLVSVTERTREIGIRMAVGARSRDILRQFLVESIMLSCLGGIVGLLLGVGASVGITMLINWWTASGDWPIVVSIPAAIVAMVFAALVGVFFGFYPAMRASNLDPIDALRFE